jgi:predicted NAD-dependent protein-ADP-ribosyltransferase YbiA (DUF1768 family)
VRINPSKNTEIITNNSMNIETNNKKYSGQPDNEIWFGDADKPYYWLTNFYYNKESQERKEIVGKPQYPIKCELPLDSTHIPVYSINEDGRINENKNVYCLFSSKDHLEKVNWSDFCAHWRTRAPLDYRKTKRSELEGILWPTAEHLYQAFKFTLWDWKDYDKIGSDVVTGFLHFADPEGLGKGVNNFNRYGITISEIVWSLDPQKAREIANSKKEWLGRPDWNKVKFRFMRWVVREKFKHPELRDRLWKTGNKKLVEHSPHDNFWGDGGDGKGKNRLGEILMEIRQEIINERGECPSVVDETEKPAPKKSEPTDKKDTEDKSWETLAEENISEIKSKLKAVGITSEQELEILGSEWETSYRNYIFGSSEDKIEERREELLAKIDKFIAKNLEETTSEQVYDAKDILNKVEDSSNEKDIINALNETYNAAKNSGDENLKNKRGKLEKKLSKDKLREIIREEIKRELTENGIKPEQLSPPVKQKFDELNNNNNNNNDQVTRTEILSEIGKKKLSSLMSDLEQALKSDIKGETINKVKELQVFISSKIDYKQNAYQKQKDKVEKLLAQALNQPSQNEENSKGFFRFNNPLLWVSVVAVIGLASGIILVIRDCRRKRRK